MAILGSNVATLADLASREDPGNKQATIIEALSQKNEVMADVVWAQGNLPTGHRTTVRTSLPTISSRKLNEGVTPGKSTTDQFTDSCALLEAYSAVDIKLAQMAADPAAYRASEDDAFIEAFAQKFVNLLFYGNSVTTPSDFTGLSPRYNDTDGATGNSMITAGGGGSLNMSVWLIGWGERAVVGIYPRGGSAGLKHEDKGEQIWQTSTTFGAATSAFRAYVSWFEWTCGLSVRDWRYAIRICNIDQTDAFALTDEQSPAITATGTFLLNLMIRAYYKIPVPSSVKLVYYCNRRVAYALHIMAMQKTVNTLTIETIAGKPITMFMGIPIHIVDQLVTEATVIDTTGPSI